MFCSNCGKEIKNIGKYCEYCGAPLENETDPKQPAEDKEKDVSESKKKDQLPDRSPSIFETGFKITALVITVIYIASALPNIAGLFGAFFSILGGEAVYGILNLLYMALTVVSHAVMAAALAIFGLCRDDKRNNTEPLLLAVICAGILYIVIALVAPVLGGIAIYIRFGGFHYDIGSVALSVLGVLVTVGILIGLAFLAGLKPFVGKNREELINKVKELPDVLGEEIERLSSKRKSTKSSGGDAERTELVQAGPRRMNEKRSILMFILVGIITCCIYMLYVYYTLAKDINEICDGDGEITAGLIKQIVFTIITCGIYSYVWNYKFMRRIQNNAKRYEIEVKTFGGMDLGACWVVLKLVGFFISWCGIGIIISIYADYLLLQNMNELSKAYNEKVVDASRA